MKFFIQAEIQALFKEEKLSGASFCNQIMLEAQTGSSSSTSSP